MPDKFITVELSPEDVCILSVFESIARHAAGAIHDGRKGIPEHQRRILAGLKHLNDHGGEQVVKLSNRLGEWFEATHPEHDAGEVFE